MVVEAWNKGSERLLPLNSLLISGGLDLGGSLARKWYREQLVDMVSFGEVASRRCPASDPLSKG